MAEKAKEVAKKLTEMVPKSFRQRVNNFLWFSPDETYDLHHMRQMPLARITMPGVDRIQGYRYPSPGSQKPVTVPRDTDPNMLYDIKYYSRDTRSAPRAIHTWQAPRFRNNLIEEGIKVPMLVSGEDGAAPKRAGSPGNKNPAVMRYDPTGLRSAMSATHEQMYKAMAARKPTQIPRYSWDLDGTYAASVKKHKEAGIPVPPGVPPTPKVVKDTTTYESW